MIKSITNLITYLAKDINLYTDVIRQARCMLAKPGCSEERISILEKALGPIPESYKRIIKSYDFHKVSVGYFELTPASNPHQTQDIVEDLLRAHLEEPFIPREVLDANNLIFIGTNNDYTVHLALKSDPFREGEIILIDEEILSNLDNPRECDIQKLSKDFKQFLIAAGNLNQIHREIKEDNSNWKEKKAEFIERLKVLDVDEEYHKAWLCVF